MRWPIRRTADRASGTTAPTGRTGTVDRLLPISRLEGFCDGVFAIAVTLPWNCTCQRGMRRSYGELGHEGASRAVAVHSLTHRRGQRRLERRPGAVQAPCHDYREEP